MRAPEFDKHARTRTHRFHQAWPEYVTVNSYSVQCLTAMAQMPEDTFTVLDS